MAKEYAKSFYDSGAWNKTRDAYIKSVQGLCERCLDQGKITAGYIVHHKEEITPDNINDPYITLGWDNLMYVCMECHNRIHFGDSMVTREGLTFDDNGELMEDY